MSRRTTSPGPLRGAARTTLLPGLLAGLAGTTAMTATTWCERRLRPGLDHPVDFDVSGAPVQAASRVLHLSPRTAAERRALFALVHWGYGSLVGVAHTALRRRLAPEPLATAVFYGGVQTMAFVLLPALGGTPPPWAWRRDVLASSLAQHAVYAAATGRAAAR